MAFDPNNPVNIGGKGIQGGLPANLQVLQFNTTTNQWEYALLASGGSNVSFLMSKEFAGDLLTDQGTLSLVGTLASITAAAGQDLYLARAKVSARIEAVVGNATAIIELQVDGVTVATYSCEFAATLTAGSSESNYEFAISGVMVTTGQTIRIQATTIDADIEVNGEIVCVQTPTGTDPTL